MQALSRDEWEGKWERQGPGLSQLQEELRKSHETGAELRKLTGAMNDIHDTLCRSLWRVLPPFNYFHVI